MSRCVLHQKKGVKNRAVILAEKYGHFLVCSLSQAVAGLPSEAVRCAILDIKHSLL